MAADFDDLLTELARETASAVGNLATARRVTWLNERDHLQPSCAHAARNIAQASEAPLEATTSLRIISPLWPRLGRVDLAFVSGAAKPVVVELKCGARRDALAGVPLPPTSRLAVRMRTSASACVRTSSGTGRFSSGSLVDRVPRLSLTTSAPRVRCLHGNRRPSLLNRANLQASQAWWGHAHHRGVQFGQSLASARAPPRHELAHERKGCRDEAQDLRDLVHGCAYRRQSRATVENRFHRARRRSPTRITDPYGWREYSDLMAKATKRWDFRVASGTDRLVRKAAQTAGRTLTDIVVDAAVVEAERVLADRTEFAVEAERWARFVELLDRPPQDMPGLEKLFSKPSVFAAE